ncbi:hypothetical protein HDU84_004316 [Entophlyctis sp. JEL0112]|nr:hypothetical protein HDU84_004316 [Entophlyctis sp. JEL0112]
MISFQADGDLPNNRQTLVGLSALSSYNGGSVLTPELPTQNQDSFISPNNNNPAPADDRPPPTPVSAFSPSQSALSVIVVDTDRMSCSTASYATSVSKDTAVSAALQPLSDPKYKHAIEIVGILKKRLAYAAMKAKNGWQHESFHTVEKKINEMYAKLPESAKKAATVAAKSKQVRFPKRVGKNQPKVLGVAVNISVVSEPAVECVKPTPVSVSSNSKDPEKHCTFSSEGESESVVGCLEQSKTELKSDEPAVVIEGLAKVDNFPIPATPPGNSTKAVSESTVPRSQFMDNTPYPNNLSTAISELPQHLPPPFNLPFPSPQATYNPVSYPQPQCQAPQYQYPSRPVYHQYQQRPASTQPPQYSFNYFPPKPYGPSCSSNHYSPVSTDKHHLSELPYQYPKHQRYSSHEYGYARQQHNQQQPQHCQQRGDNSSVKGLPTMMVRAVRPIYGSGMGYSNAAAGGTMRLGGAGNYVGAGAYGTGGTAAGGLASYAGGHGVYYGAGGSRMGLAERRLLVIVAIGSRGDIQPALALANGVCAEAARRYRESSGADATHTLLVVPANYHQWIAAETASWQAESYVSVAALANHDVEAAINSKHVADRVVKADATVLLQAIASPKDMVSDMHELVNWCQDADTVVVSAMSTIPGAILHEAFGTTVLNMPMFPGISEETGEFPPMSGLPSFGPFLNKFLYLAAITLLWFLFKPTIDKMRDIVGLPPASWHWIKHSMKQKNMPVHHTWSSILQHKPADWDPDTSIGGYMFYHPSTSQLPDDLESFLATGLPPVYVGFGSMPIHLSAKFFSLIRELLQHLPKHIRVVLYAGGMSSSTSSDTNKHEIKNAILALDQDTGNRRVHVVYSVPQHLLFPRCCVIVHHGGSGTTGEALLAGVPSMACPLIGDQHFWAERIAAIGCGPRVSCAFRRLTGGLLARRIVEAMKEPYVTRAREVGNQLRAERGTDNAVAFVMRYLWDEQIRKDMLQRREQAMNKEVKPRK